MEPPIRDILLQLILLEGQTADEEDECHGAVDDGVLGADDAAVSSDRFNEAGLCQPWFLDNISWAKDENKGREKAHKGRNAPADRRGRSQW